MHTKGCNRRQDKAVVLRKKLFAGIKDICWEQQFSKCGSLVSSEGLLDPFRVCAVKIIFIVILRLYLPFSLSFSQVQFSRGCLTCHSEYRSKYGNTSMRIPLSQILKRSAKIQNIGTTLFC